MMLLSLCIALQMFYSIACLSCHNCPMQSNTFNSILTVDTIPEEFKDCSFMSEQMECAIRVTWTRDPDQTGIALIAGGERRVASEVHNLENTITLSNNAVKLQWTKSIVYKCSTEQCNSPSTLKRLLRSLKSDDDFHTLSNLLTMNTQFNGSFCFFFANSTVPCETEMDQNTCKQCAIEEYIQSKPLDVCANCAVNDVTENMITREVKFFMGNRERHDFWMIECQQKDCNGMDTGDLIREKSDIQFNFDLFLNNRGKGKNVSSISIIFLALIILNIKIFH